MDEDGERWKKRGRRKGAEAKLTTSGPFRGQSMHRLEGISLSKLPSPGHMRFSVFHLRRRMGPRLVLHNVIYYE